MAFKPIDPKRDEFRRYLERSGVIEALTKVFVRIVKERPENPLDYLRHNLGDSLHQADSVAYLQSELEEARCEIQRLRGIIENVNPEALEEQPRGGEDENVVEYATNEIVEKAHNNGSNVEEENSAEQNIEHQAVPAPVTVPVPAAVPSAPVDDVQQADLGGNMEAPAAAENGNDINNTIPPAPTQKLDNNS